MLLRDAPAPYVGLDRPLALPEPEPTRPFGLSLPEPTYRHRPDLFRNNLVDL